MFYNDGMRITSPAFENNGILPKKYSCDGDEISPPLEISQVPSQAQSLVLIVEDPDAPSGLFTHWIIWNIEPDIEKIEEGRLPKGGIAGKNSIGDETFVSPCPPSGTHRYYFRLFALDTVLELPKGSTRDELEFTIKNHIIDKSDLLAKYSRSQI